MLSDNHGLIFEHRDTGNKERLAVSWRWIFILWNNSSLLVIGSLSGCTSTRDRISCRSPFCKISKIPRFGGWVGLICLKGLAGWCFGQEFLAE
ncbi:hypothetical protein F5X96DRAFT_388887 [Biscogniauxia mediterranea]|nr:hypothetical protein F5X96DRAFT_388887 [Biscogniauxia mediterranea]